MSTFVSAVLCVGLSVVAQFLLKTGMSGVDVKTLFVLPFTASVLSHGWGCCRNGM